MIIQNFDNLSIIVNSAKSSFFPKDRIFTNEVINNIITFSNDDITNDMQGNDVVSYDEMKYLFISLFDNEKNKIFKNLNCQNLSSTANVKLSMVNYIDFDISKIDVKYSEILNKSIILGISYITHLISEILPINNAYGIRIKNEANKKLYRLSDFGGWKLKDEKVKMITSKGFKDCFLTLRDVSGKVCNQMPLNLLSENLKTEKIIFDNYQLDVENSYIEIPTEINQDNDILLTFYY